MSELKYRKKIDSEEKSRTSSLYIEQLKLDKIKNELQELISTVNYKINELKVEELQLNAHYISQNYRPPNSNKSKKNKEHNDKVDKYNFDLPDEVNKQLLDLDTFIKSFEEELESD